jgi:hypothetical protein
MHAGKADPHRSAVDRSDSCFKTGTEHSQCAMQTTFNRREAPPEMFHRKAIARIHVRKFRRAYIRFSNNRCNARQCQFELFRLRRQWNEQTVLNDARLGRNGL